MRIADEVEIFAAFAAIEKVTLGFLSIPITRMMVKRDSLLLGVTKGLLSANTFPQEGQLSKYYPTTNGKAGGQTTKKVKEPLYKTYEKGDDISYRLFRI